MLKTIQPWKCLKSRILLQNKYVRIDEDTVRLPDGSIVKYYIESRGVRAVAIIAQDRNKKLLCQREYRYAVGKTMYEFPGGVVEPGETPLAAARRELREETGYTAKKWQLLGTYRANPSRSGVQFWVYLATDVAQAPKELEHGEYIVEGWMPKTKLRKLIKNGTINGQGMLSAYLLYLMKAPQ